MSRERQSGEGNGPWRPTADFYKSQPRSAEIYGVCAGIIQRVDSLRLDHDVANDKSSQQTLYAELEGLGGKLIELDVTAGMNIGLPIEAYQSNPVTAVEWAAGQLYPLTGHSIVSETAIMPIIDELNESEGEEAVVSTDMMPKKLRDFHVEGALVSYMRDILDIPVNKNPEEPQS